MLAGVGVRQSGTMPTSGRTSQFGDFGSFPSRTNNDEVPAVGQRIASNSKPWASSIWNNNTIGSGFGPSSRDGNRGRAENSIYNADNEAKKGSASLIPSSESELWSHQRSPWGTADASSNAKGSLNISRSSGVSPSRPFNNAQAQAQPSYIEPQAASPYFAAPRAGSISHTSSSLPRPRLDPTSGSFSLGRPTDALNNGMNNGLNNGINNGFAGFGRFADVEGQAQRAPDQPVNTWGADAGSVHSPSDDRRSVANSDYFVSSSAGPSRSGSLPPSRHGQEPPLLPQNADAFSRMSQMPSSRGHNSSFSSQPPNGRMYAERSGSIQSDSLQPIFGRLSLDNDAELPNADLSQGHSRYDESALSNGTSYGQDNPTNGFYGDSIAQPRGMQYNSRMQMTPGGSNFRQSPYHSHAPTPPVFDHLYPSRSEQHNRVVSATAAQTELNPQMLDRRLQVIQYEHMNQEQQRLFNHSLLAGGAFRHPYHHPYYNVAGIMNLNTLHSGLQVPGMGAPFGAPFTEIPSGPRDPLPADIRSKCLDDFKANLKTKKYELKDIYEHIAEFSGDQHGSRFIQGKLETANSEEKERVFREIYPECLQLMQDVFGNYVIQKFFEHGDQSQKKALANRMKGNMLQLSLQMYGCRVVQKALEHILTDQQASLVKELENHVVRCVKDQNGNHVIQKAIERVPPEHIQFIFKAFNGQVATLATHAYGCRVIQRMLEHCEPATRDSILQELHQCGASLITDSYGNYVTQHIIEHGGPADKAKVIGLIRDQLLSFSRHKFASNVVEKCLVYGNDEQRRQIMLKIIEKNERGESNLLALIKDGYGNYVIQKLLDTLSAPDYATFVEHLQPEMQRDKKLMAAKHVQAVEKKMHRYDRSDSVPDTNCRSSISTTATSTDISAAATPPPLINDTQSPQSTSVPSANNSTIDEPLQTNSSTVKPSCPQDGANTVAIAEAT